MHQSNTILKFDPWLTRVVLGLQSFPDERLFKVVVINPTINDVFNLTFLIDVDFDGISYWLACSLFRRHME